MKILLILVATVGFVASYGSPVEYQQRETFETGRNPNIQITQNSAPELKNVSPREHYQAPRTNNQPTREEYRRFGKDASSQSTQDGSLAVNYSGNERRTIQNQNAEPKEAFSTKNQVSKFPPSESTPVQKSSFNNNQDIRADSRFAYSPVSQIQATYSSQESHRSGQENAEDHSSVTSVHSQELLQKGTPFAMDRRSDIRSGMFQSNFGASFPRTQDQGSQNERPTLENHDNFRSAEDQRSQNQRSFYQNEDRRDHGISSGEQAFNQVSSFVKQEQIPSSHRPQEQVNQYQKSVQQNQRSGPVSSYEKDNFFNQGQTNFDSRRISSSAIGQPLEHTSGDQNRFISARAQFANNQQDEKSQNRQVSDVKEAQISTNIPFKDNKRNQLENHQQNLELFQGDHQALFQSIRQSQPILTVPQAKQAHATSVLVSGAKSMPAAPVVVYKTGSAASPHAVVLGRDLSVLNNKASVSQHLQTPYAQYTYTHPL